MFEIFASMRMSVVVVVVVLVEVVGQKAERKLVVTQKVLLFWLWYRGRLLPLQNRENYFMLKRTKQGPTIRRKCRNYSNK